MKIILTQNVPNLGMKNEIKEVQDGYAKNYLFKNKLAVLATESRIKQVQKQQALQEKKLLEQQNVYKEMAKQIEAIDFIEVELNVAKEGGESFEAVKAETIRDILKNKYQIVLDENVKIHFDNKIKEKGDYEISIKFPFGITSPLKLKAIEKLNNIH